MSVNTSTGLVQDPFGVAPLAQMLGLATTDVTTVCCGGTLSDTDRINPFSLIRPLFRSNGSTSNTPPGTLPSWFANSSNYTNSESMVIPAAKRTELYDEAKTKILTSGLPCVDEYGVPSKSGPGFTEGEYFYYKLMKWGFIVPYVTTENAIFALKDLVWQRFGPRDSARNSDGSLKECWADLMQFDGYDHYVKPADPIQGVVMEYGKRISVVPAPPVIGRWKDAEVCGDHTKTPPVKAKGGPVSIPAVFPSLDGYYYGASLYKLNENTKRFNLIKSTLGAEVGKTDASGNLPILNAVDFGSQILSQEGEYILIPWVATGVKMENGEVKAQTGAGGQSAAKFFSFRFAEQFLGYARKQIEPKTLIFYQPFIGQNPYSLTNNGNGTWTVSMNIYNKWEDYPLKAYYFLAYLTYKRADGVIRNLIVTSDPSPSGYDIPSTVWANYVKPKTYSLTLPANVDNTSVKIVSDGTSTTITRKSGPLATAVMSVTISLTFSFPDMTEAPNTSNPEVSLKKVAFRSQDANFGSAQIMNHTIVYDTSGGLKPLIPIESFEAF